MALGWVKQQIAPAKILAGNVDGRRVAEERFPIDARRKILDILQRVVGHAEDGIVRFRPGS